MKEGGREIADSKLMLFDEVIAAGVGFGVKGVKKEPKVVCPLDR